MPWQIRDGPHRAPWGGRDAVGWRWTLASEAGATHAMTVWVSGTAMAVAAEYLPAETEAARATEGRSEVERLLNDEILPREVLLGTGGRSIDPGEAGWWIELAGDEQTLSELANIFASERLNISRRAGQFFLRSVEFDENDDEQEVRLRAATLLREALGAVWLQEGQGGRVEVGAVQRLQ